MQKPRSGVEPGDVVRARGEMWRVRHISSFASCALATLDGLGRSNRGRRAVLIHPFDRLSKLDRRLRPVCVGRRRWMALFRSLVATSAPHDGLVAAVEARMDLLPYQLEPALAVSRGVASRLLLADEVGLGKTIQAGLVLAELQARGGAARSLILTPAGLRDQWADELSSRFSIRPVIVDAAFLRRTIACLPADVNPWSVAPVTIASLDFVKRPEVLRAIEPFVWDLLVIDEAHNAAADSDRGRAARALGARARLVLLLTATPHAGDSGAFAALCDIGRLGASDGPILLFRRSRADVGLDARRRVHLLRVGASPVERRLHALLDDYTGRVWREAAEDAAPARRLAAVVLQKRALSSATALARSIRRRLALLPGTTSGPQPLQAALPLADPDAGETDESDAEPIDALCVPGLRTPLVERGCLEAILEAAELASASERKLRALARLLRRSPEPAIVFTEYRDTAALTAEFLAPWTTSVLLHGGLGRAERKEVERAFTTGRARVLVTTDVGSEGLNLQSRCRLVVNLELPWNPMRLEQRIGRVERIGQARTVHAVHLVAGGTAEEIVLARLAARVDAVRRTVGHVADPLGLPAADEIEAAVMLRSPIPERPWTSVPDLVHLAAGPARLARADPGFRDLAIGEAGELAVRRRLLQRPGASPASPRPLLTAVSVRHVCRASTGPVAEKAEVAGWPGPGVVALFRVRVVDDRGHLLDDTLVPLFGPIRLPAIRTPREARALLEQVGGVEPASVIARRWADARVVAVAAGRAPAITRACEREAAIADRIARDFGHLAGPVQAGLFDRRNLRLIEHDKEARATLHDELRDTGPALADQARLAGDPELVLVLMVT